MIKQIIMLRKKLHKISKVPFMYDIKTHTQTYTKSLKALLLKKKKLVAQWINILHKKTDTYQTKRNKRGEEQLFFNSQFFPPNILKGEGGGVGQTTPWGALDGWYLCVTYSIYLSICLTIFYQVYFCIFTTS